MRAVAGGRDPKYRAFGLDKIIREGTEYYRVQMGDDSGGLGKLTSITGDIDVVAILTADRTDGAGVHALTTSRLRSCSPCSDRTVSPAPPISTLR